MKERITISQTSNADMNIGVHKTNNMTPNKQEIDKRVKLAEEIAEEISQMKPIADVAKDLADHVDKIVLAKMIETAKNKQ